MVDTALQKGFMMEITRRNIAKGAAWAIPAITVADHGVLTVPTSPHCEERPDDA